MSKIAPVSYPGYFQKYIDLVPEKDISAAFKNQQIVLEDFFNSIPAQKHQYAYAEGKWTIQEMLQHIIDTERILGYRAVCFARGEQANLPGFDENEYAAQSDAHTRNWNDMVKELLILRQATEMMFAGFTPQMLSQKGIANNNSISVMQLGQMIIGHVYHHKNMVVERYL
ncbi:MAG TPA: DinB family protein [Ferruginibacter sp.]|nr:DinB family protein [Ferruginibacter sp.]HMP21092.1 DinB family protein [Ferruginibacter sp.]